MPTLTIDGIEVEVENGMTILQACEQAGIEIPRFCYHERLSIAGNCRMCLVEMEKAPKPVASCAMPAGEGMVIHTNTPLVKKAREGVMEFLLINHPLDCPICDQGGECDLQDQSMAYGIGHNRFHENKRAVKEKNMGPLVKTVMTRCIHCTRCVRFADEVAGVPALGAVGRGENTEITTYQETAFASELSGNVVDLCPVGALTSKPYAFTARPWELKHTETIDVHDALGSNIRVDARGREVLRVLPRLHDDVNEEWISDKARHAIDGLHVRRLDRPYVKKGGKLVEASWNEAFEAIAARLKGLDGKKIAGLVGDLQDVESMYALKLLLNALGSDTVEGRQAGEKIFARHRVGYLFNSGIAGIDESDACLLIGTNPRTESPVLNARLRRKALERGYRIASVGEDADLTYKVENLGADAAVLKDILDGKNDFAKALEAADKPMLIIGAGALGREDGAAILKLAHDIADKYGLVKDDWNGFNVLHSAAARVGALDLGLVTEGGVEGIVSGAEKGDIEVVFNLGADEIDSSRLDKAFVIYQGSHGDAGVKSADVILPGVAYTEKPGTYVNTEGRVQLAQRAIFGPGDAREDWTILRALSEVLGQTLPFNNLHELRSKLVADYPQFAEIDVKPAAEWADFGVAGDLSAEPLKSAIDDFYLTNPIARASATMADCSATFNGAGVSEEATGTNG
ncbi:NADH-quinone oxidoreductase subunit NuoG [Emcibacter nanhaiensis]|uniref:NADH-quinone oxidoreductase n=1 Tax=Emcibacter nanhaiensis TaxID=1505037 RepID=A0A501PSY8_9PROT|nr:NADH-quinone oxidoreductase subunit NuoG [Emcibacter nanhaiensis]TPD62886.1 NADH-quinone oxidoreductase subunit G [Emcibacter nanhaiensis]